MSKRFLHYLLGVVILAGAGCANISTPTGGRRDTTPPKRLTISPADSLKNTRVKKIELTFDEYITLADAAKEIQISPLLSIEPVVTSLNKKVTVKIADTLLEENTTYRLSFGSSIRDLHENNPYPAYTYVFSTGAYFDSLQLSGKIKDAGTGLPDTGKVLLMLYTATDNDSAIVRHKPKYVGRSDAAGNFVIKGLPKKSFRIYAVKDDNDNLSYDAETEMIAFVDHNVLPGDTAQQTITLSLFKEIDSAATSDTSVVHNTRTGSKDVAKEGFFYSVNVDTSNQTKRTFDITKNLVVNFTKKPVIAKEKVNLSYDSSGISIAQSYIVINDTASPNAFTINTDWKENTVYTLRMAKGFAKDTAGADAMPSKYIFRTKEDEDYGKINIHLPGKYNSPVYVLQVTAGKDTIYQKPVTDTLINLSKLKPEQYTFRIIEDRNRNGKWDAGHLLRKIQPEEVIPYLGSLTLKAGWENTIDFEQKPEPKKTIPKSDMKK